MRAHPVCEFIDASPSPFHVCATAAARLRASDTRNSLRLTGGRGRSAAGRFSLSEPVRSSPGTAPTRVSRSDRRGHTDSPNLRGQAASRPVGGGLAIRWLSEPYGGAWLSSWLDRDLGSAAGCRCATRADGGVAHRLVRVDEPILRVLQLAIHLSEDRTASEIGPAATRQRGCRGWGRGRVSSDYVADLAGIQPSDLLAADLMTHDLCPSALIGVDDELCQRAAAR